MKTKSLTSLFAIALALVACNRNETEPAFTPELKLDKTEKITASAEGGSVDLKVTANVSWTATVSDEDVATVSPASKEITDKKSAETPLTLTISANTATEARTATLTLKAEGCKDIVVEIEQAAAEIPDVFEVLDDQGNPVATEITAGFSGGTVAVVYVNSNISWTATSSDDSWLTVDPASYTAEVKEVEPVATTITATANPSTTDGRTATITFAAEGFDDIVITVTQEKMIPFTAEVDLMLPSEFLGAPNDKYPDWNCLISYIGMPTAPVVEGGYGLWKKSAWDDLLPNWEENTEAIIARIDEYGAAFENEDLEQINELVDEENMAYWLFSNRTPETEYILVTKLVDGNGRVYVAYAIETTAKEPEIPYTGELVLGNYLMTDTESLDQPSSNVFTLKSADGGDTNYLLTKVCNQADTFNWKAVYDKSAGTLTMSGEAVGYESYGPLWFYSLFQVGSYSAGYIGSGESGEEPVVFTVDPATKQINGLAEGNEISCFAASGTSILGYFSYFTAETTAITYQSSASAAKTVNSGNIQYRNVSKAKVKGNLPAKKLTVKKATLR